MPEIYRREIEEKPVSGKPLGRHIEHDPRSRGFTYVPRTTTPLASVKHRRRIPVLDQGWLGSCTGNAGVGAIGTAPLYGRLPEDHPALDEHLAVHYYSRATKIDGISGEMPEEDTGSTGLAVAKVMMAEGVIRGYQHTFSISGALTALARQPIMIGTNWYEGFDTPGQYGRIRPTGEIRGGHEYVLDGLDVENQRVWATNSWGASYGKEGRMWMTWACFERLLDEDGDVIVPLRLLA